MQAVCKQIGRVAPQDVNVLILGESGTGKELVARAIYHHSHRNQAPFVAINCAAIPESLLESELFGHERVGGNEAIAVDVRIVAATNQDLDKLILEGRFRKDLYYRLRGVTIHLPPVRERPEDSSELAHYFLFRFNRQLGTSVQSISEDTLKLLQSYPWPGNVRELQSVIREALIASTGVMILPEFLPVELHQETEVESDLDAPIEPLPGTAWSDLSKFVETAVASGETDVYRRAREQFDRLLISRAMQQANGNQNRAAEILGLSRVTLRAKLCALRLSIGKVVSGGGEGHHLAALMEYAVSSVALVGDPDRGRPLERLAGLHVRPRGRGTRRRCRDCRLSLSPGSLLANHQPLGIGRDVKLPNPRVQRVCNSVLTHRRTPLGTPPRRTAVIAEFRWADQRRNENRPDCR